MESSESIGEIAAALAKAQAKFGHVHKNRVAKIPTSKGSYSYNYADLASCINAIQAPLNENGLALVQTTSQSNGNVVVETTLIHSSGQWLRGEVSLPAGAGGPQAVGSSITYGRRYGLSIVGLVTDDDEDAQLSESQSKPGDAKKASTSRGPRVVNSAPPANQGDPALAEELSHAIGKASSMDELDGVAASIKAGDSALSVEEIKTLREQYVLRKNDLSRAA